MTVGQLLDGVVSELFVLVLIVPLSVVMIAAVWRRYRVDLSLRPHDPPKDDAPAAGDPGSLDDPAP